MANKSNQFSTRFPHFGLFLVIAVTLAIPLTVWSMNNVSTQTKQEASTTGSFRGFYYYDANKNNAYDKGDEALGGDATIVYSITNGVKRADGRSVFFPYTNNGYFNFSNLRVGTTYMIRAERSGATTVSKSVLIKGPYQHTANFRSTINECRGDC